MRLAKNWHHCLQQNYERPLLYTCNFALLCQSINFYTSYKQTHECLTKQSLISNLQNDELFSGTKSNDPFTQNEDIIELQDVRMSPIASIRNRHNSKANTTSICGDMDPSKFPPSFRISRTAGYSINARTVPGLRFRGGRGTKKCIAHFFKAIAVK